ncbi:MAG: TonB-dependent receptor [Muribaculaceae bacterium]|nr:TonB-dependent receptor [Muribaculaceae bacterium]
MEETTDSISADDEFDYLLDAVTVTAQKPLVTKEIDRIGYDVQADTDAKTSQLDEILKKVPLVSVDPDGTIKIKGSTDFKIYKNGRPNSSFTRNAKDIFKSIPASMIKKIEVITDPGAREDAEGTAAILNIVTMGNTIIKGVMGNANLNYSKQLAFPSPYLWLQTQLDKVNLSVYGGYNKQTDRYSRTENESKYKYTDSGNEISSSSSSSSRGEVGYFGLEGSFEPDTLNLITAEFNGYTYNFRSDSNGHIQMNDDAGNMIYSYSTHRLSNPIRYFDLDGGLNWQRSTRKKGENITLSYMISTTNQTQNDLTEYDNEVNMPVAYSGIRNDFTLDFIEQTGQLDWTRPINDFNKFDVGAKYINRNNHSINNQDYFDWETRHSDFTHNTQVLAAYFDYRLNWKKLGARAGLRYEYSHLSAKYPDGSNDPFSVNLSDWVPNAAISWNINDAHTLKLGYSTRINRPGISQLNPAVISSPTSISSGNPDLESSRHQSINLNYNHISRNFNLDLGTSYSFINNAVIAVQELLPGDIVRSGYANSGHNKWFNIALWMDYTPWSKTSFMLNANLNYAHISNPSLNISSHGWGGYGYIRVRQQLPWDLTLTGYLNSYVSTPSLYGHSKFDFASQAYYGFTLQKSMLKEKRLSIRLSINNPFGRKARVFESIPDNMGYTGYSKSYSYGNSNDWGIQISYRFGNLRAQVKKTDKSISNDDVENRRN